MRILRRLAAAGIRLIRYIQRRNSLNQLACRALLLTAALSLAIVSLIVWSGRGRPRLLEEPRLTQAEARSIAMSYPLPPADDPALMPAAVKIIHFMYKGYRLSQQFRDLLTSWRKVYPDYQILFWTDTEIDQLISRLYPAWQHMYYRQLSNYMERSDAARAFVLHAMGGWYADIDTGCLSRADGLASKHALILPLEPYLHALNNFRMRRLVSNAIMYSVPQHPFWMFYLHRLRQSLVDKKPRTSTMDAAEITGPVILTEVVLMFQQAHNGTGCPEPWCPLLAPPVRFLPVYDNSTVEMRQSFRQLCGTDSALEIAGFAEECRRFEPHSYRNYAPDPGQSSTYHAFLHLNQRAGDCEPKADVRNWGLKLIFGEKLTAEISRLGIKVRWIK